MKKKPPSELAEGQFDGGKIEGRLTVEEADALTAYMGDRFLTNKSDVLRSALAQFLVREGYLENPIKQQKRSREKSGRKSRTRHWGKMTRGVALVIAAAMAWLSTASALSNPNLERTAWRISMANGDVRQEHLAQVSAIRDKLADYGQEVTDWFFDLEPAYQTAIGVAASIMVDLVDGKLLLLGGLELW